MKLEDNIIGVYWVERKIKNFGGKIEGLEVKNQIFMKLLKYNNHLLRVEEFDKSLLCELTANFKYLEKSLGQCC